MKRRKSLNGWMIVATLLGLAAALGSAAADDPRPTPGADVKACLPEIDRRISEDFSRLEGMYKQLHTHPELSLQEVQSAARLARELREVGFEVTEKVGGTGTVGVLRNGKGPTVLVRTDMDALPVVERTGLPYASQVTTRDKNGNTVGVMHACGHDMHICKPKL
jgi:hippurate hydrolase